MSEALIYRDRIRGQRRTFEVVEDRVHVRIKSFNLDAEVNLQLSNLRPTPDRIYSRDLSWWQAGVLLIVGTLTGDVVAVVTQSWIVLASSVSLGLLGVLMVIVYGKKSESMQFKTNQDLVALMVCRNGPDRNRFDEFTAELIERIKRAQEPEPADTF